VASSSAMIDKAVSIQQSRPMDVMVGGGTRVTSNQIASFRTAAGLSFSARVMTNFGPNILPVHRLNVVKNNGTISVQGDTMTVSDYRGDVVLVAYLCSDILYRWWPEWPTSCSHHVANVESNDYNNAGNERSSNNVQQGYN
jgi:hypothetical protein